MFVLIVQVMMMVLPLLIFVLLPKVVNTSDPEMRRVITICDVVIFEVGCWRFEPLTVSLKYTVCSLVLVLSCSLNYNHFSSRPFLDTFVYM